MRKYLHVFSVLSLEGYLTARSLQRLQMAMITQPSYWSNVCRFSKVSRADTSQTISATHMIRNSVKFNALVYFLTRNLAMKYTDTLRLEGP